MRTAGLLWQSVRHTRGRQLLARLRLVVQRRVLAGLARVVPSLRAMPDASSIRLRDVLPRALFPPRAESVSLRDGRTYVRFLSQERELTCPMEWEPQALAFSGQLWRMQLHYMEYLEVLDDEAFVRTVSDWIDSNPPYGRGYWREVWNAYTVSVRCVVWMQQFAARSRGFPSGFSARMLASLLKQVRFVARNLERDLGGNHLVRNVKALLWAARFFAGPEAERWGALGRRLLVAELEDQVLPDGFHYERSPSYHAQVLADLIECLSVLDPGPLGERLSEELSRMAQALADTTHPDGLVSLFNDGGLHASYAPAACLAAYRALTGRSVTARETFALDSAGYFGAREGASYVVADCGPVGPDFLPAHAHGDILSFEWSVAGVRLIVDAGVYEYEAGLWRDYARSTRAHNTVTVDDRDQCEFWGAFRVGRRARVAVHEHAPHRRGFVLEGSHDGYVGLPGSPRPRRRFTATPERIEVEDTVEGGAGQRVRARLLCHPECRVEIAGGRVHLRRGGVHAVLETGGPVELETAWWCPDFGVGLEAPRIVLQYGSAPCTGGFVLSVEP